MTISRSARFGLLLAILLLTTGCDQLTKAIARASLAGAPLQFGGGILQLTLTKNSGGVLSLGDSLPPDFRTFLFTILTGIGVLIGVVYLLVAPVRRKRIWIGVALIVAGGIGNIVDRILWNGFVTDFCILSLGPLHTGVFNLADTIVTTGAVLVLWPARRPNVSPQGG